MHTVSELQSFARASKEAGMSEDEVYNLITCIAVNPEAGDEIVGSGGCRKLRFAGKGKGKSGGYRIVTFFTGVDIPVYLITVFSKGERSDLTQAERNNLRKLTIQILDQYKLKIVKVSANK